jgi:murein DD-endopeptidase MepM/ murein hydrolase activator NlpD
MVFVFFGVRDQRAHYPIFRILIIAGILGVIKEETMRFNVKFTAAALIGALSLVGGASAYAAPGDTVTIQPGDTLSAISTANGSDYVRVFNANPNIANPDIINAGDQIRIPTADEQLPDRMGQVQAAQITYTASVQQPSAQSYAVSPQPQATQVSAANGGVWDTIAQCESGGNWSTNTGNGYSGGLQFAPGTWAAYGDGSASAAGASKEAQIAAAEKVLAAQGWGAWPSCSAKAGLR